MDRRGQQSAALAQIVADSLLHFNGDRYWMGDLVVMPNHVHLLAVPKVAGTFRVPSAVEAVRLRCHSTRCNLQISDYHDTGHNHVSLSYGTRSVPATIGLRGPAANSQQQRVAVRWN